jgi:hypothetical protein
MNDVANHATGIPGSELPERDRAPAGTAETREAIRRLANDLRGIESRMANLCATLPEPGEDFDPLAEMWGALHCVNNDLIADAVKTLQLAATRGEADLRRDFDQRQQLLADPRRIGWELLAFLPLPQLGRTPESERRQHDETRTDPGVVPRAPRAPRRRPGAPHRPPAPPAPPGTDRDPGQAMRPNADDDH